MTYEPHPDRDIETQHIPPTITGGTDVPAVASSDPRQASTSTTASPPTPRPSSPPFTPPLGSSATRRIVVPEKGSLRGALVTRGEHRRVITFESELERKVLLVLLARPDVVEIREQVAPVTYRDAEGVEREHRFDFLVRRRDGRRVLVAVKPMELALKYDLDGLIRRIARHVPRSLADSAIWMSERDVPRHAVFNATLLHCVRADGSPAYDRVVEGIASTLAGTTTVASLVAASGLAGEGFRAVVRLIDRGMLRMVGTGRIDYGTKIERIADRGAQS